MGVVLIAAAGFLLGGAYSMARLEEGARNGPAQSDPSQHARRLRPAAHLVVAGVLVLLALYLIVAGIIQLGRE